MYVCMYVCMYACMHACMHACLIYVCMCVYMYIYIYIYIYIIHICVHIYIYIYIYIYVNNCLRQSASEGDCRMERATGFVGAMRFAGGCARAADEPGRDVGAAFCRPGDSCCRIGRVRWRLKSRCRVLCDRGEFRQTSSPNLPTNITPY